MAEPSAILRWNDTEIELPVVRGTEGELAIDISKLRSQTGLITLDYGYVNTGATESSITYIDGDAGILRYRGYDIQDLADQEHPSFLETAWLLIYGELPTMDERESFSKQIRKHTLLHEDVKRFYDGFPRDAHPMAILSAVVSALSTFYQSSDDPHDPEQVQLTIVRLIAKLPTIAAYSYKKSIGQPFLYPDNSLDLIENFLRMMFAVPSEPYEVSDTVVHALKQLLILHADHEQNCSTSTVRLVGSSDANLYASIAAGINALWGPLHGGANQAVVEMLEAIRDSGGDLRHWVDRAKDRNDDFRLSGFGHRVYKNYDPRAKIIKEAADRGAEGARRARRAVRHRARARAGRAHRRLLHRAQAVPERRLLLGPHLPRDGVPDEHVPGALRPRPAPRVDRALDGAAREPEDEDRAAPADLHRADGARVRPDRPALRRAAAGARPPSPVACSRAGVHNSENDVLRPVGVGGR
ncbi:MAG: hypothetical protein KatS3mg010_0999 [Acidimicrobiia bacterium]|nr:MAG: hypothetical protein KatS3mg010_0999 [Acidimicrobiia bacterium]